jgi:hypothetical protein
MVRVTQKDYLASPGNLKSETMLENGKKFDTELPSIGQHAIVCEENGILHVYTGKLNKDHKNYCIIDHFHIGADHTVEVVVRSKSKININFKLTDKQNVEFRGKIITFKEFVDCLMYPEKAVKHYKKHSWLMKLFGEPAIEFYYINKENPSVFENTSYTLKEEYWTRHDYRSNNYVFIKFHK